jgi:hypothetical protein
MAEGLRRDDGGELHQSQVLGGHVTGNFTCCCKLTHGVAAVMQHLYDSQPMRVGQSLQALRRLPQRFEREQLGLSRFALARIAPSIFGYIAKYRFINTLPDRCGVPLSPFPKCPPF